MRFREHILLLHFAKRSKWTHGIDLIHWFIAVRSQNVRREDILNVAIDEQAQLLGKFRERERERVVFKGDDERTKNKLAHHRESSGVAHAASLCIVLVHPCRNSSSRLMAAR